MISARGAPLHFGGGPDAAIPIARNPQVMGIASKPGK
jgi:hypothetical protein